MKVKVYSLTSSNFSEIVSKREKGLPDSDTIKTYEEKSSVDTLLYNLGAITSKGKFVGFGRYVSGSWDPILKPGYAAIDITVSEEWRNTGIGSQILDEVENIACSKDIKVLQTTIPDIKNTELEWAKKKGFEIANHTFASQLELSSFDYNKYNSIFRELESSGIHFMALTEYSLDEDTLNRFWNLWWELVTDVPGMENKPRPDNKRMTQLTKEFDKNGFILAVQGDRWIGLSMIVKEDNDTCYNSMTGVDQEYRGRGIALALKLKSIKYSKDIGVKYIRTNNDSKNHPMLSLNEKLGYKSNPGFFGLVKIIERS